MTNPDTTVGGNRMNETVNIFADGSYTVTGAPDAAIEAAHDDYLNSLTVGELLERLADVLGMANKALVRDDRKLTISDYKSVLALIRRRVAVRLPPAEQPQ